MTNNNWIETMKTIGKISSIHPEIVDEFILITKDLLTKKDQEHKAELEMIKGEVRKNKMSDKEPEWGSADWAFDDGYNQAIEDTISILDSHINKLSTEQSNQKELYEETIQIITRRK